MTNIGLVSVENLVIEDTLVPFEDMTLFESVDANGNLDLDEVWTLTYTYTITEEDVAKGSVLNKVSASSPGAPDGSVEDETITPLSGFTVKKTASSNVFTKVDEKINYTIVITNIGTTPIHNLRVNDSLIDITTLVPVKSLNKDDVLDVGETWTYTYSYAITKEDYFLGTVFNSVTVEADETPPVMDFEGVWHVSALASGFVTSVNVGESYE